MAAVTASSKRTKAVVAAAVGNVLEWFDFGAYVFLAKYISANFFPTTDPFAGMLLTLATYAVGGLIRPLGGILFGNLSDRVGRRAALSACILAMMFSTVLIGCLPTYGTVGVWAPVLLVALRVAQGLSVGGEQGCLIAYITEYATDKNRGLIGSWQQVSAAGGFLLASFGIAVLVSAVGDKATLDWAWRIPFLLGGVIGVVGYYLRAGLDETPEFTSAAKEGRLTNSPLVTVLRHHKLTLLTTCCFTLLWTVAFNMLFVTSASYIQRVTGISQSAALYLNSLQTLLAIALLPVMGSLSDRIGRKKMLLVGSTAFLFLTVPLFYLISLGSIGTIIVVEVVLAVMYGVFSGPAPAAFAELWDTEVRTTGMNLGYNITAALFGATTPLITTYLLGVMNTPLAPTFWYVTCAFITLLAVALGYKERSLRGREEGIRAGISRVVGPAERAV